MPRQKDNVRPSAAARTTARARRKAAAVRTRHRGPPRNLATADAPPDGPGDDDDLEMLQARFVAARTAH